ncbi:NAD-dependent epimerase/dehydratase [Desulfofarcimen acetoxidans DSM 771]|uniref:NAD-dependent epimerase/dehydratase n=1 Tax=Desulfofarcimen acetoxidans (strain ATCC 49208 / DSM 771 / KCTC 5769 / VKM B-1644 / 5575) TaxID=485916 RepID=C8W2D6_DESAS|nr:SDR family oxidoreductase [Desulfofarcimen acetoxidans]ACV63620.1 NAD-dependent epimerase/dehydratase [Desulfofarcimen acetoxidans DSM 771]
MRCLVTGGAGFIGSNLVHTLINEGYKVRVLDNFSTGKFENIETVIKNIDLIVGDLCREDDVRRAVKGVDIVFHQAALPSVPRSVADPYTTNRVNIEGTLNVFLAARDSGVKRVVYASSSSVYGSNEKLPKEETMLTRPMSPYAASKLAKEVYGRIFYDLYGLETVGLRYFNVFGPRQNPESQYAAVIPKFITALLKGKSPDIYGDGEQSRDFTYISDVVKANLLAARGSGAAGEVFNIARGTKINLNELLNLLKKITGSKAEAAYAASRPGDVKHSLAAIEKAQSILGYQPEVSLEAGLRQTVAWFGGSSLVN